MRIRNFNKLNETLIFKKRKRKKKVFIPFTDDVDILSLTESSQRLHC